jgi:hypothetical protein
MLADFGNVNTCFNTTRLQPRPRDKKLRRGQKIQPIRSWHVTGMVIVCAGGEGGMGVGKFIIISKRQVSITITLCMTFSHRARCLL